MDGQSTHDEAEARKMFSTEVFEFWGMRDPIGTYETYLVRNGISKSTLEKREQQILEEVGRAEQEALSSREKNMPNSETAIEGVYSTTDGSTAEKSMKPGSPKGGSTRKTSSK